MAVANIECVCPLSPVQEGMLFHALYAPEDGLYVAQSVWTIEGDLNRELFRSAWATAIARHPALRTSFHWEQLARPLQAVSRDADIQWHEDDWHSAPEAERDARLSAHLDDDLSAGFDLTRPPLARIALFRTGERRHELVLTTHHLVIDGWSKQLVVRDVLRLYEAAREGTSLALPATPPPDDYMEWLARQDLSAAETYWRRVLDGHFITRLAPARDRGVTRYRLADADLTLSHEATDRLRQAARSERVTLNTLALGACALLLARCTGARDVMFGATVSGRSDGVAGIDRRVGMFINTLPVRTRFPDAVVLGDWLRALQRQQAEGRQFEYTPLSSVQQWCGVGAGDALFDMLFVFENYPVETAPGSEGIRLSLRRARQGVNYPLALLVTPKQSLHAKAAYDASRFEESTVKALLRDYADALLEIAGGTSWQVAALACARRPGNERSVAMQLPNESAQSDVCGLHDFVDTQASADPLRCAIDAGTSQLTYADLRSRAGKLANYLRRRGVTAEVPVVAFLDQSVDLAIAPLAIWKAGGVYVPIDPKLPPERTAGMLRECRPRVILTHESQRARLPANAADIVCLDGEAAAIEREPANVPRAVTHADNLAYVLFTSGSTGTPKGVAVAHRGLVNLAAAQRELGVTSRDRVLQGASPSFDACVFNLSLAFSAGASLVIASDTSRPFSTELVRLLAECDVSIAVLPPSMWAAMPVSALPSSLRLVVAAGEACPIELVRRLAPGRRFLNLYGPTEHTIWATVAECDPNGTSVSIGLPIANTEAYVLGANLQPVLVGLEGELYLSGVGIARGYLGRPSLTGERFVPHPLATTPGLRLYRTGDRVRLRADGTLEFIGRLDDQVKIRGHRVEPGEVEAVLRSHPLVEDAAIVVREPRTNPHLVAYVLSRAGTLDPAALRAWMGDRLPEYMVPVAIATLPEWPVTHAGKLDRARLPAVTSIGAAESAPSTRAPTDLERGIAAVWKQVLGTDPTGIDANFFEAGGNSILALRVYSQLRDAHAPGLSLVDLFQFPTIRTLARHLNGQKPDGPDGHLDARQAARRGARRRVSRIRTREGERWDAA